jgi:hypothetical protein
MSKKIKNQVDTLIIKGNLNVVNQKQINTSVIFLLENILEILRDIEKQNAQIIEQTSMTKAEKFNA